MAEKSKNTVVLIEPFPPLVQELVNMITEKGLAEVVPVATPDEAVQIAMQLQPCMLVACMQQNGDVPSRVQMLKKLETSVKQHCLKVLMVSKLKNRQVADLMTSKLGVADFIEEPIPARTLMFKANLQLKAIDNFRKIQEAKKAQQEQIVFKKTDAQKPGQAQLTETAAKQKPALKMVGDMFLFKNNGLKKNGKKILVEVEGPAPETGEWVQHEDKGDAQASWRWVPNEEKEAQAKGEAPKDGWVHKGERPVFNEQNRKWQMLSEKPELALHQNGQKVAEKISTDEKGEVVVAEDSPEAEENLRKNLKKAAEIRKAAQAEKESRKAESKGKKEAAEGEEATSLGAAKEKAGSESVTVENGQTEDQDEAEKKAGEAAEAGRTPLERGGAIPPKAAPILRDHRTGAVDEYETGKNMQGSGKATEDQAEAGAALKALDKLKRRAGGLPKAQLAGEKEKEEAEESLTPLSLEAKAKALRERLAKKDTLAGLRGKLDGSAAPEGEESEAEAEELAPSKDEESSEEGEGALSALARLKKKTQKAKDRDSGPLLPKAKKPRTPQETALLKARVAKARNSKQELLRAIKEKMAQPLPELLPPEEEEAIREELGLKDLPHLKDKELAKRKRLDELKKAKEKLAALDLEIESAEEEGAEHNLHDLTPDEAGNTQPMRNGGELHGDAPKGITGAYDSENADSGEEEDGSTLKKRSLKAKNPKKTGGGNEALYMPEADLQPLGNAWETTGEHYVYLNAQVRYKGFSNLADLLPLWIFAGKRLPELLDKSREWRFYGELPTQARAMEDIPPDVREFLIGLRDNAKQAAQEEKDGARNSKAEDRMAKLRASLETTDELSSEESAEDRAEDAAPSSADEPVAEDRKSPQKHSAQNSDEERPGSPEMSEETGEAGLETAAAEARGSGAKEEAELDASEEPAQAESDTTELDRLRAKLSESSEDLPHAEAEGEPDPAPTPSATEKLEKTASPAMQDFLERRKARQAAEDGKQAPPPEKKERAPASNNGPTTHLGVLVALSDALFPNKEFERGLAKVLHAIEIAFPDCTAVVTGPPDPGGQAALRARAKGSSDRELVVSLQSGTAYPIRHQASESEEVLGYLFLRAKGGRTGFEPDEERTATKVALGIWPLIAQPTPDEETKAA